MTLGLAIMADASGGLSIVTVEAIAILLLFEGFLALALFTLAPHRRGYMVLVKALALLVLGCMILDFPVQVDIENSLLFGLAFLIDGGARIATASVVRFPSGSWSRPAARSRSVSAGSPSSTGRSATTGPCRSASASRCCCPAGPSSGSACACGS